MGTERQRTWTGFSVPRPGSGDPYLRVLQTTVYVRDQDRSLRFYREKLGFDLIADLKINDGERLVAVSPPDGSAYLELCAPAPGSEECALIGRMKRVRLLTEDVDKLYRLWSERGVAFHHAPQPGELGGVFTLLDDPDGNTLTIAGFDDVATELDARRKEAADRLEEERRARQEMDIAQEVQARLLPQAPPESPTLELAGVCVQSRAVGGDYFDFDDLGHDRLRLAIGDVAGKGMAAALLMVSLQANLRNHAGGSGLGLPQLLSRVNERFYRSTGEHAYATLLLLEYNGAARRLHYVNCGHLPGLVLRADGSVDRLGATATVLGLFPEWAGELGRCTLEAGEVLILYTDGVTESPDALGAEFGEERLLESARRHRGCPAEQMLERILGDVRRFSTEERFDDVTMLIAKGRPARA